MNIRGDGGAILVNDATYVRTSALRAKFLERLGKTSKLSISTDEVERLLDECLVSMLSDFCPQQECGKICISLSGLMERHGK